MSSLFFSFLFLITTSLSLVLYSRITARLPWFLSLFLGLCFLPFLLKCLLASICAHKGHLASYNSAHPFMLINR